VNYSDRLIFRRKAKKRKRVLNLQVLRARKVSLDFI